MPVHPVKKQVFAANGGYNVIVFKDIPLERRQAAARSGEVDERRPRPGADVHPPHPSR